MATYVRDIINGSLKILGVLAEGETATASQTSDALSTLNDMIDSFSNESLVIYSDTREEFTLTPGQLIHTLGPSGDFDTTRPIKVSKVLYQSADDSNYELPVTIREMEEYASITNKNTQSDIPSDVYIDAKMPTMNLYFWPVASVAYKAVIFSEKVIQSFIDANVEVVLPPGYAAMLKYNLAEWLEPQYGLQLSQRASQIAMDTKANIKRTNKKQRFLRSDAIGAIAKRPFDWRIGE